MADDIYLNDDGAHSVLGPSGADKWFACPGSVTLDEVFGRGEQETSEAAAEGTAAHYLFAQCLTENKDVMDFLGQRLHVGDFSFEVRGDFARDVQRGINAARRLMDDHTLIYVEQNVKFHSDKRATGSVDLGLHNVKTRALTVVDFKFGFKPVEVEGNKQCRLYTAGLRRMIEGAGTKKSEIDTFRYGIIQPRVPGNEDECLRLAPEMTRDQFLAWEKEDVTKAIRNVKKKKPTFAAGEHCWYCPHQTRCKTFEEHVAPAVAVDNMLDTDEMPVDKLVAIYERTPIIKKFLANVAAALKHRLENGIIDQESGVKLVKGRSSRLWRDPDTIERAAIAEFGEEAVYETKFKTPPAVEKLKGGKDFVKKNAYVKEGGLTLALASVKKEGVTPPGASVFDGVSGKS